MWILVFEKRSAVRGWREGGGVSAVRGGREGGGVNREIIRHF